MVVMDLILFLALSQAQAVVVVVQLEPMVLLVVLAVAVVAVVQVRQLVVLVLLTKVMLVEIPTHHAQDQVVAVLEKLAIRMVIVKVAMVLQLLLLDHQ
jgi:hypothetical protein